MKTKSPGSIIMGRLRGSFLLPEHSRRREGRQAGSARPPSEPGSGAGVGPDQNTPGRQRRCSLHPISASEGESGGGMPMKQGISRQPKMWRFITESK